MWFARFQILICEPQSIWRKLLLLSWLYQYGFIFSFKIHMLLLIFVSSFCVIENSSYSVFLLMAINHQVCFTKVRKSSFPCGQLWCVLSTPFGVPFHLPVLFLNDYSNGANILKSCWTTYLFLNQFTIIWNYIDMVGGGIIPLVRRSPAISHRIILWSQNFSTLSINIPSTR